MWRGIRRRPLIWIAVAVVLIPAGIGGFTALSLGRSWQALERQPYDQEAFESLPPVTMIGSAMVDELPAEDIPDFVVEPVAVDPDDPYQAYLIVGSDEGDLRADVIIVVLMPGDGSAPIMFSLPRDLYLPNRCTQGLTRINANFNGCGADINGPTLLSGAIQDFTGIEIDHFVLFTMDGFERIIDALGGIELCLEHPIRDRDAHIELPAGCQQADGASALGWVRSRQTQEYVDGRWRTVSGVSDLTRNQHQQELILSLIARAGSFDSPQDLTRFAASLSDAFTLDDRLGMQEAVGLAWTNRGLDPDTVVRLTIPVTNHETMGGAQVLLPAQPFAEVLAQALADSGDLAAGSDTD